MNFAKQSSAPNPFESHQRLASAAVGCAGPTTVTQKSGPLKVVQCPDHTRRAPRTAAAGPGDREEYRRSSTFSRGDQADALRTHLRHPAIGDTDSHVGKSESRSSTSTAPATALMLP